MPTPLPSGSYFVEHWSSNKVIEQHPTGPWNNPVIGDLQSLAQKQLRNFWKPDSGSLVRRIKTTKPVPDLVIIRSPIGEETCRWSLDDERATTGCS